MSSLAVMKKLVSIGLPAKWLVPVMEAFEDPTAEGTTRRKRRKRRTREEMARDMAKAKRKKGGRKKKVAASA